MINKTKKYMKERQLGETTGHDWWHTLRVYNMAVKIGKAETQPINMEVVELAALLHDIEDWKFNDGDETAGPRAAKEWLNSIGVDQSTQDHVAEIIINLSYKGTEKKSNMKTLEGMVVQDADRLDAIGAIGVARLFAFGATINSELFNPEIPPRIEIDSEEYKARNVKTCSLNHFYEKLFNLIELMNTETGKNIAQSRHTYILDFVKRFLEESGCEDGVHYMYLKEFMDKNNTAI